MEFGFEFALGGKAAPADRAGGLPQVSGRVDPALWSRLRAWREGPEGVAFVLRLDEKLQLKPGAATRLADEYVRFLALCLSAGETMAPSAIVDEAWHLHLLDSRTYFDRFCPEVLGRVLHHAPGRPPPDKDPAHERTREVYATAFGHAPPPDIWPDAAGHRRLRMFRWAFVGWIGVFICTVLLFLSGNEPFGVPLFVMLFAGVWILAFLQAQLPMRKGERSSSGDGGDGCGGD
jgi:hypothetical protein